MKKLKRIFKGFENAMAAAAFAEEGEFETARGIMNEGREEGVKKTGKKKKPCADHLRVVHASQSK